MSEIRFNRWSHQSGTGGIYQDSSGNIGIGTSTPTSVLDIQGGSIKIGNDLLTSSGVSTFTSGLNVTGGSVGIGTDNPSGNFDVFNTSRIQHIVTSNSNHIAFWKDSTPTYAASIGLGVPSVGLYNDLTFSTYSGSWTERLRITSGGNIGIGTDNPGKPLHIFSNNNAPLKIDASDSTQASIAYALNGTEHWYTGLDLNANGGTDFFVYDASATTNRVFIDGTTGAIGINTNGSYNGGTVTIDGTLTLLKQTAASFYSDSAFIDYDKGTRALRLCSGNQTGVGNSSVIVFNTIKNGTVIESARIDGDGNIKTPYQISFCQLAMSGTAFNSGTMTGGNSDHNVGGHYNTSTGIFTAPVDGYYQFGCGVLVETGTGRLEGVIAKNGTGVINFNGTGTTYDGPSATGILLLSANDNVRINRINGTAHSAHGNCYFWGRLLG